MSSKLIQIFESKKAINNIILSYSSKTQTLIAFYNKDFCIIDNIEKEPKVRLEKKVDVQITNFILHPQNENQILIPADDGIYLIKDLQKCKNNSDIIRMNVEWRNIISIKFSYFDNCFAILNRDKIFKYYYIKEDNTLEQICNIKLEEEYVDFHFCPKFAQGFEIFMTFFITINGGIKMYGPFFPPEFYISKYYISNMENYLLQKLSIENENNINDNEFKIYCLSLNVIDDLKKSIKKQNINIYEDHIISSEKIKVFNTNFKKKEIKVNENFLNFRENSIISKNNYKQIYILDNRPLTILRISEKNEIDVIMVGQDIMPLDLAQTGNIMLPKENQIVKNFFIEFVSLDLTKDENPDKKRILINHYNNNELYIQTSNSLFHLNFPYLNDLKTIAEENINYYPNKILKTSIIKLLKWSNNQQENYPKEKKSINIINVLNIPKFQKFFVFALLCERKDINENKINKAVNKTSLKIREKIYSKKLEESDMKKFDNLIKIRSEYDKPKNDIKSKLMMNDLIYTDEIKNNEFEVVEEIVKKKDFEKIFDEQMNDIFETYKDIISTDKQRFMNKINIMKEVYKNDFREKKEIDETVKDIEKLKKMKEEILKKNKIIEEKMKLVKDKINQYEMKDDDINNYLETLGSYHKSVLDKLIDINNKLEGYNKKMVEIFSNSDLYPDLDMEFNLISKENQNKYLLFESNVNNEGKKPFSALNDK